MTDSNLEIITSLIDRIEALEMKLADQDKIIQAWEKVHLPTPEEAVARIEARQATDQSPNYSHEESYILIWGAEKFERVWK